MSVKIVRLSELIMVNNEAFAARSWKEGLLKFGDLVFSSGFKSEPVSMKIHGVTIEYNPRSDGILAFGPFTNTLDTYLVFAEARIISVWTTSRNFCDDLLHFVKNDDVPDWFLYFGTHALLLGRNPNHTLGVVTLATFPLEREAEEENSRSTA